MGTGRNGSPLANTLIINTRNRDKHPITVLSIPEFLKYMNESEDLFRHGFIVTLKRNPPVGTPQDDWDKLIDEINSIKVNIHMAKSMLTMSALS